MILRTYIDTKTEFHLANATFDKRHNCGDTLGLMWHWYYCRNCKLIYDHLFGQVWRAEDTHCPVCHAWSNPEMGSEEAKEVFIHRYTEKAKELGLL